MKNIYIILLSIVLTSLQAAHAQDSVFNSKRVAFSKMNDNVQWLLINDTLIRFIYNNDLIGEVQFQDLHTPTPQTIRYTYEQQLIRTIQYPAGSITISRDLGRAREIRFSDNDLIRLNYTEGHVSNIEFNQTYNLPIFYDKKGHILDPKFDTAATPLKSRLLNRLSLYNRLQSLTDINGILDNREYYSDLFSGVERTGGKVSFPIEELSQTELNALQIKFPQLFPVTNVAATSEKKSSKESEKSSDCCPQRILFALEAGANIANLQSELNGNKSTDHPKTGLTAGFTAHIPISIKFSFEPGLYFVQKGMTGHYATPNRSFSEVTLQYAELPLNIAYSFRGFGNGCFQVGAGPYVAMAFAGKGEQKVLGGPQSVDLNFGSDLKQDFSQYDYGGQAFLGYIFKLGIFLRASYHHGFANIVPSEIAEANDAKSWNRCASITAGYQFGRNK